MKNDETFLLLDDLLREVGLGRDDDKRGFARWL